MKYLIVSFLGILLLSCNKEVEIEIPPNKHKIVAYSTISPFAQPYSKSLSIKLQESFHIFDTTTVKIEDAVVLYFENEVLKDTLKYNNTTDTYAISNEISDYPTVGNTYSIEVQREGYETITATTKIPSKVTITDTTIVPISYIDDNGRAHSEFSVTFTDPAEETNYYEIAISTTPSHEDSKSSYYQLSTYESIIISESYYPSLIRFDVQEPKSLLFSDKSINGKKTTLKVFYCPSQEGKGSDIRIVKHYAAIHLRNVTYDYYKFKTSFIQHSNNKKEDVIYGMREPLNIISNINNGYGLFAGYNYDIAAFRFPD